MPDHYEQSLHESGFISETESDAEGLHQDPIERLLLDQEGPLLGSDDELFSRSRKQHGLRTSQLLHQTHRHSCGSELSTLGDGRRRRTASLRKPFHDRSSVGTLNTSQSQVRCRA